jgi:tetratricopeptide (TPR) repeat protein
MVGCVDGMDVDCITTVGFDPPPLFLLIYAKSCRIIILMIGVEQNAKKILALAEHYFLIHKYDKAQQHYETLLEMDPQNAHYLLRYAECLSFQNKCLDQVENIYKSLITRGRSGVTACYHLAGMYIVRKEYSKAKAIIDSALNMYPDSLEIHASCVQYYTCAQDFKKAAHHLEMAKMINANHKLLTLVELDFERARQKDLLDSDHLMEKLYSSNLSEVGKLIQMALIESTKKNYIKAFEYTKKAYLLEPGRNGINKLLQNYEQLAANQLVENCRRENNN